jgi:predicted transcriptional regulator
MRLESYLAEIGQTQNAFAEEWGIVQSAVWKLCDGKDVRGRMWAKIAVATKGKVTPGDHFPFVPPAKRGRPLGKATKAKVG